MENELLTQEDYEKEIVKCSLDYIYCLKTYGVIRHPKKGRIPFKMFDFQDTTLEIVQNNDRVIVNKGRQLGLSTLLAGYIACEMMFKEDYQCLAIANKGENAVNLVKKIKIMLKEFPPWMTGTLIRDNDYSVELDNGSFAKATATSDEAGRSEGLSLLLLDEAAFIKNMDSIWTAAHMTLATGGQCIVLSTPNGVGNWFHTTFTKAQTKENNFVSVTLPWYVHPDRDQAWRDNEDIEAGDSRTASQENDCSFITSGMSVIDGELIKKYEDRIKGMGDFKTPVHTIEESGPNDKLWVYEMPVPYGRYIIAADNATAGGSDYCACHVFDLDTMNQCAEFKDHINPADFGHFLGKLATLYNNAFLVIENNSIGLATVQAVLDDEYENLYWTKRGSDDFIDPANFHLIDNDKDIIPGFSTNTKTRPLIIQKFQDYVNSEALTLNSARTINEMWTFIWEGGKAQASKGNNDDLIISLSIALWVRDHALKLISLATESSKKKLDWVFRKEQKHEGLYAKTKSEQNPYSMPVDPKGNQWNYAQDLFGK